MNKLVLACATAAVLVLAAPVALAAPVPTPAPVVPPSIVQLCAATGVDEVDDLIAGLSRSDLAGELSPLLTLLVPNSQTVELDASVQLDNVREKLNCAPTTTTPPTTTPPTTTPPTTAPTTAPTSTSSAPTTTTDPDVDGDFGQIGTPPRGGVATGTR